MIVSGWASTTKIDCVLDSVQPGAFDRSIRAKGLTGPKSIKLLAQHDPRMPLGLITKLEQRHAGLWIEADVDESLSYAKDLVKTIHTHGGLSYSIGYKLIPGKFEMVEDAPQPHFKLWEVDLHEVSIVTFPCNDDCVMSKPQTAKQMLDNMNAMASPMGKSLGLMNQMNKLLDGNKS